MASIQFEIIFNKLLTLTENKVLSEGKWYAQVQKKYQQLPHGKAFSGCSMKLLKTLTRFDYEWTQSCDLNE